MMRTISHYNARLSWKINISLLIIASPLCRFFWGRRALTHLYKQVVAEPNLMAFLLLARLGRKSDPVFVWHVYDLLLKVPDSSFEDSWVKSALLPLENIHGANIRDRISLCERVIMGSFGLWKVVGESAKVPVDYPGIFSPKPRDQILDTTQIAMHDLAAHQESAMLDWTSSHGITPSMALNDKEAFAKLVMSAAEKGDSPAQFLLAGLYGQGYGVAQNSSLSDELLHKAAAGGSEIAQCTLGYMYFLGVGVQKDTARAREWLSEASTKGFAPAARALSSIKLPN